MIRFNGSYPARQKGCPQLLLPRIVLRPTGPIRSSRQGAPIDGNLVPMSDSGKLVLFEGPDGVGKSTLITYAENLLIESGVRFESLAFPGKSRGTLGWIVDRIHHNKQELGVKALTPLSLQALHIAAHLDHIETTIVPRLTEGALILLDRFWWSTWVYGIADNVSPCALESLIDAERHAWGRFVPALAFLVTRPTAFRPEHEPDRFHRLCTLYNELASRESRQHPIVTLSNDQIAESHEAIRERLRDLICATRTQETVRPT